MPTEMHSPTFFLKRTMQGTKEVAARSSAFSQISNGSSQNLAEVMAAEERAQRDFERTTTPKSKELSTAAKLIEQKMARHGEVSMTIVTLREDLDDTTASLEQDRKFLTDLTQNCDTRKKEFHEVRKARNEELQALSEVIKALNDDEAWNSLKKHCLRHPCSDAGHRKTNEVTSC